MQAPGITLAVIFRHSGWRWPLGTGDGVQVWEGDRLVAEFPGEFVLDVLRHHLAGIALQHRGATLVSEAKPVLPSRPIGTAAPPPRLPSVNGRKLRGR